MTVFLTDMKKAAPHTQKKLDLSTSPFCAASFCFPARWFRTLSFSFRIIDWQCDAHSTKY